jgi:rhodanese-related sulfurtransferase
MRIPVAAVALVLFLLSLAFAEPEAPRDAPSIAPSELSARRTAGTAPVIIDVRTAEEFATVDVRTAEEFATDHIPGALNIPFDQVAERISEVDAPHGVALYCMVGPRARKGEAALLTAGYKTVFHLEGGLAAWQAAGLPTDR